MSELLKVAQPIEETLNPSVSLRHLLGSISSYRSQSFEDERLGVLNALLETPHFKKLGMDSSSLRAGLSRCCSNIGYVQHPSGKVLHEYGRSSDDLYFIIYGSANVYEYKKDSDLETECYFAMQRQLLMEQADDLSRGTGNSRDTDLLAIDNILDSQFNFFQNEIQQLKQFFIAGVCMLKLVRRLSEGDCFGMTENYRDQIIVSTTEIHLTNLSVQSYQAYITPIKSRLHFFEFFAKKAHLSSLFLSPYNILECSIQRNDKSHIQSQNVYLVYSGRVALTSKDQKELRVFTAGDFFLTGKDFDSFFELKCFTETVQLISLPFLNQKEDLYILCEQLTHYFFDVASMNQTRRRAEQEKPLEYIFLANLQQIGLITKLPRTSPSIEINISTLGSIQEGNSIVIQRGDKEQINCDPHCSQTKIPLQLEGLPRIHQLSHGLAHSSFQSLQNGSVHQSLQQQESGKAHPHYKQIEDKQITVETNNPSNVPANEKQEQEGLINHKSLARNQPKQGVTQTLLTRSDSPLVGRLPGLDQKDIKSEQFNSATASTQVIQTEPNLRGSLVSTTPKALPIRTGPYSSLSLPFKVKPKSNAPLKGVSLNSSGLKINSSFIQTPSSLYSMIHTQEDKQVKSPRTSSAVSAFDLPSANVINRQMISPANSPQKSRSLRSSGNFDKQMIRMDFTETRSHHDSPAETKRNSRVIDASNSYFIGGDLKMTPSQQSRRNNGSPIPLPLLEPLGKMSNLKLPVRRKTGDNRQFEQIPNIFKLQYSSSSTEETVMAADVHKGNSKYKKAHSLFNECNNLTKSATRMSRNGSSSNLLMEKVPFRASGNGGSSYTASPQVQKIVSSTFHNNQSMSQAFEYKQQSEQENLMQTIQQKKESGILTSNQLMKLKTLDQEDDQGSILN